MSSQDDYGGGGSTTTSTTPAPFNPDNEIPSSFDRNCPPNSPCSSTFQAEDYSGPDEVHLSGLSFTNATYTSVDQSGGIYKANGRRAYRRKTWSTYVEKRGWIYFDTKSACWRFSVDGTESSPNSKEYDCVEYSDTEGNSIGCKIEGIRINQDNRNCTLNGLYIMPDCGGSSSPVGDWYCPVVSLLEQEADPVLTCESGPRPFSSYTQVGGLLNLTSAASCVGSYKIVGDEDGICKFTYLSPTPNKETDAELKTVKIKLNEDNTCTFGFGEPTPTQLKVGDSHSFFVINGKNKFNCKFTYLEQGSAIAQMANTDGELTFQGSIGNEEETVGGSFSCDTNRIYPKDRYICKEGDGTSLASGFHKSTHNPFSYALFKTATITTIEGGFEIVDVAYEGVVEAEFTKISINTTTVTDPIDTHENFCSFAGSKGDEKNGAIFNDDNSFKAFELVYEDERNEFAGVKSYLNPSLEVTEVREYSSVTFSDVERIGTICKPRKDSVTNLDVNHKKRGSASFLCTGVKWQAFGTGCIATSTYRLSGKNGWDKDIYERG